MWHPVKYEQWWPDAILGSYENQQKQDDYIRDQRAWRYHDLVLDRLRSKVKQIQEKQNLKGTNQAVAHNESVFTLNWLPYDVPREAGPWKQPVYHDELGRFSVEKVHVQIRSFDVH